VRKERIQKYWNEYFGIDKEKRNETIIVVPHNHLEGYNGAWIFQRENKIIISVKPKLVDQAWKNHKVSR